jgi:predicted flavoprotein YhiN
MLIMLWDVIVVGGGAAGLWAAGTAAARGLRVLVLEKNRKPGVKILMSGGTRCNITHHCDIEGILQAFGQQGRFLKPALHRLKPSDVVQEIERLGVATKVEESGKVFPVSDRALDVRDALVRRLSTHGREPNRGSWLAGHSRYGNPNVKKNTSVDRWPLLLGMWHDWRWLCLGRAIGALIVTAISSLDAPGLPSALGA